MVCLFIFVTASFEKQIINLDEAQFIDFCFTVCAFYVPFFSFSSVRSFLAMLGLHCCVWAFSNCDEHGLLFAGILGPLTMEASLAQEHRP